MTKVLVTGGAGYIGSHAVLSLLDAGHAPVVLDDLSTGTAKAVPEGAPLEIGDAGDRALVGRLLREHGVEAVMHFAGSLVVPESVADPMKYYRNNTMTSFNLIEVCLDAGIGPFVFSSTAAVYGSAGAEPVGEDWPTEPVSPYGASKLMVERMLMDAAAAHPALRPLCLRYFNVAGADPLGRAGQRTRNATHLIHVAIEVAMGRREALEVFGEDYPTRDGTCVRDYIHVSDLADAHLKALEFLLAGGEPQAINCGYGRGATVREVVTAVEHATGRALPTRSGPRRPGDPACVVADPSRIHDLLAWAPRRQNLNAILSTALAWRRRLDAEKRACH